MMSTDTVFGFLPSSAPIHWVSLMTPNFQGSAHVSETPINVVKAKANTITLFKQNSFFIVYPPHLRFLKFCLKIRSAASEPRLERITSFLKTDMFDSGLIINGSFEAS
jgi:hypothetical protein